MRILKNALLALFILTLMTLAVSAEAPAPEAVDFSPYLYQEGALSVSNVFAAGVNEIDAAKSIILEALRNGDEIIDFTGSGVYYERDIVPAFPAVVNENPELFYVAGTFEFVDYKYDSSRQDWYDMRISPDYNMPVSEIPTAKIEFQAELDRIISYASPATTPLMKALMVNDYFCVNYHYDTSKTYHDAYTLLVKKTGVCQSYMLGYKVALRALGIPVKTCGSDAMNHTWNLVQIDGAWYHVDVTWDDPIPDQSGYAAHNFFMRSDAGFLDNAYGGEHYSWDAEDGITATSTRFDDAPWCKITRLLPVYADSYYIIKGSQPGEILKITNNLEDVFYSFDTTWKITTPEKYGYWYTGGFSRIGSYRDYLVFTMYDGIYALSLKAGSLQTVYTPPADLGVWDAVFYKETVHYALGQDYDVLTEYGDLILDLGGVTPVGDLMILPEQTEVVEAGAFRNTKIRNLVCNEELTRIESLAFADCTDLETAEFGAGVTYIADDAFSGSKNVVFICPTGSYAAKYAAAHGFATDLF